MPLPPPPPHTLRPPGPHSSPHIVYALLSTRQRASAFNQPLSFDTSSVADVGQMFFVRSARALAPPSLESSRAFPVHAACAATTPRPPASRPAPPPASHALPSTRQYASAFNQPLSLDTSKVTRMYSMFMVCAPRVPWPPGLGSVLPRACRFFAAPPPHAAIRLPARTPRPTSYALLSTWHRARTRSTSR